MPQPEIKCTQTFRLPIQLAEKIHELAKENRRRLSEEATVLLEDAIAQREMGSAGKSK